MSVNISTDAVCKSIRFASDNFLLRGVLHLPAAPHPPVVVGCHGLFSSGNSPKQIALAQKCNECGMAFFRFDHRGCGESEGNFTDVTSLKARCEDLRRAVETLRSREDIGRKIGLFGSSMGGAVCIAAAGMPEVDSIVTIAAPLRISSTIEAVEAIRRSADSDRPPDPSFYKRNLQFDISDALPKIHGILLFHGEADEVIPVSHGREIYQNVRGPKRLIVQNQGDHRMSNPEHQKEFMREAVSWFKASLLQNE